MNENRWTRHLLPLPQEFAVSGSRRLETRACGLRMLGNAPQLLEGARQIREALATTSTSSRSTSHDLLIEIGVYADFLSEGCDDLDDLSRLPNASQAYQIRTLSPSRVLIAGHDACGALYGATTFARLLAAGRRNNRIEIPFVDIVDWPDIQERGLWNFPGLDSWIPWLASMKLNYGKMADTRLVPVRRGRRNEAVIDQRQMEAARQLGLRYLPYVVHLNFLHDVGLYRAYPELAGRGVRALAGRYFAHKEGNQHRAPCASRPRLVKILGEWLASMASQGADEVSCWLSERPCQCECEQCTPVGQFLLETRAFVRAWQQVQEEHPHLVIRIFSSTTTPEQDDQILAELPPAVRFERACASGMERVAHQPRDLFANPLLDTEAGRGRWIASYDVPLGAYGNVDTPETKVPQFSGQRIRDYVSQLHRRQYSGAYGMLAWGEQARSIYGFAIAALAEYAWNNTGRPVADFAVAWAVQEGYDRPEAIGRWADLLGEVEFDVYDGGFPMAYTWGQAARMVEEGSPPRLGAGLFRHFQTPASFDAKLERCRQARKQLTPTDHQDLILATDVVASYVGLAQAVWHVAHDHAHGDLSDASVQRRLARALAALEEAGQRNATAIRTWRQHLGEEPWHHRVHDAINATLETVRRITRHISEQHLDLT